MKLVKIKLSKRSGITYNSQATYLWKGFNTSCGLEGISNNLVCSICTKKAFNVVIQNNNKSFTNDEHGNFIFSCKKEICKNMALLKGI